MTHDPYQTYPTFGAYSGLTNPFSSPYTNLQASAINPAVACNPLAAQQLGVQGVPNYAQQLQLATALAQQAAIPQMGGVGQIGNQWQNPQWQSPFNAFQNPLATAGWQNPYLAAALQQNPFVAAAMQMQNPQIQNPAFNPILAQLNSPFGGQIGLQPYSQFQQPYQQHQHQLGHAAQAFGQQSSPFGQFNSPLAPQSWVGQGLQGQIGQFGGNQGYGQVNPILAQLARALQGGSPWSAF